MKKVLIDVNYIFQYNTKQKSQPKKPMTKESKTTLEMAIYNLISRYKTSCRLAKIAQNFDSIDDYKISNFMQQLQISGQRVSDSDEEANAHYESVIRAFVSEALELSQFLEKTKSDMPRGSLQDISRKGDDMALVDRNFHDWVIERCPFFYSRENLNFFSIFMCKPVGFGVRR